MKLTKATNSKEALKLIKKAKKGEVIIWDEASDKNIFHSKLGRSLLKYASLIEREKDLGCGVLFKSGSGIIICGEKRVDGNSFLCKWCLKENNLARRWWR